jgi:hypothetical protein
MLYYSVAHYFDVKGSRKGAMYAHISSHIKEFLNTDEMNKEFVLVSFIDSERGNERYDIIKKELEDFCQNQLPHHKVHVIVEYNWGGTIAGLWYSYLYLKSNSLQGYIAHFEEDFGPKNNNWYKDARDNLKEDIIYVGEVNGGRIKRGDDDNRLSRGKHDDQPRLGDPEVWTDGGFYFSTIEKFMLVEEKVGTFHKGDQNTKYDRMIDGISLGEVGFPTLLHHANFTFSFLPRAKYFRHEWVSDTIASC